MNWEEYANTVTSLYQHYTCIRNSLDAAPKIAKGGTLNEQRTFKQQKNGLLHPVGAF